MQHHLPPHGAPVSELDRLKEQLVYLRFWLGIMVVTEITLVGWLISTPNTADPVLWSLYPDAEPHSIKWTPRPND